MGLFFRLLGKLDITRVNSLLSFSFYRLMRKNALAFLWWCPSLTELPVPYPNLSWAFTITLFMTCLTCGTVRIYSISLIPPDLTTNYKFLVPEISRILRLIRFFLFIIKRTVTNKQTRWVKQYSWKFGFLFSELVSKIFEFYVGIKYLGFSFDIRIHRVAAVLENLLKVDIKYATVAYYLKAVLCSIY